MIEMARIRVSSVLKKTGGPVGYAEAGSSVLVNVGEGLYRWGSVVRIVTPTTAIIQFEDGAGELGEKVLDASALTLVCDD